LWIEQLTKHQHCNPPAGERARCPALGACRFRYAAIRRVRRQAPRGVWHKLSRGARWSRMVKRPTKSRKSGPPIGSGA